MKYVLALLSVGVATLCCLPMSLWLQPANLVMPYLAAVVMTAYWCGRWPSMLASVIGVLIFDFVFVPPYYTLAVAHVEYVVTFLGLLVVGLVVSALTSQAREQALAASRREEQTAALYNLARELARARTEDEIRQIAEVHAAPEEDATLRAAMSHQAGLALERARLAAEAREAERIRESERLQAALLDSVSHDLRIPLVSITGALSALSEEGVYQDPVTRRSLLENARSEADRLNRLVSNLLQRTRLEAGPVQLRVEPCDLEDLVATTLPAAGSRPVRVLPLDGLPLVSVDYMLVQQVLLNLLDNAVKYTPEGSEVEISARAVGEEVEVSVADRGPGVPEGEAIFAKFFRLKSDGQPGTGLGLSICKGLVEAHGGRIWTEPRAGGGSIFRFTLPRAQCH